MLKAERPILFSGPMVRAIFDGSKTQTRRIVKWQGPKGYPHSFDHAQIDNPAGVNRLMVPFNHPSEANDPWWENGAHRHYCPYGDPGDRLWVRETWRYKCPDDPDDGAIYFADGYAKSMLPPGFKWKPSIHMFRKDSRITLEITGVRVERLQAISEADAKAEGISDERADGVLQVTEAMNQREPRPYAYAFEVLWESINGRDSWDANPWVWVVEFRRIKP